MNSVSSQLGGYVNEISKIGGELGPMVVRGMILLLLVLLLVKYLGKFVSMLLIKAGIERTDQVAVRRGRNRHGIRQAGGGSIKPAIGGKRL